MLQDFVFMKTYVRAAGLFAALPAFQIIRGIDGPAFRAGKVLQHLGVPRFVSGCPDPLLRFPQLDPVRRRCLERFQVFTGILRALTAEVHPFIGSAFRHGADVPAVKASFFRTASVAMQFPDRTLHALSYYFQSCRLFRGPDKYRAGGTKEPAGNSGEFFINGIGHRIPFFKLMVTAQLRLAAKERTELKEKTWGHVFEF
jgi:hypothetical protein